MSDTEQDCDQDIVADFPEIVTSNDVGPEWCKMDPIPIFDTSKHKKRMSLKPEIRVDSEGNTVFKAWLVFEPLEEDEPGVYVPMRGTKAIGRADVDAAKNNRISLAFSSDDIAALKDCLNEIDRIKSKGISELGYVEVDQLFSLEALHKLLENNFRLRESNKTLYEILLSLTDVSASSDKGEVLINLLKSSSDNYSPELLSDVYGMIVDFTSKYDKDKLNQFFSLIKGDDFGRVMEQQFKLFELESVINELESEIKVDHDEDYWQKYFTSKPWILSFISPHPFIYCKDKVNVGGQTLDGNGGVADFLCKNKLTSNVCLVEIKKSVAKLVCSIPYRDGLNTYSMEKDVSGGVMQVLDYKESLTKNANTLLSPIGLTLADPQCVLIVGMIGDLKPDQKHSFELYRSSLKNVTILTYDEIIARLRITFNILSKND